MSVDHILERARQRYGLHLEAHDVNVILKKIGTGGAAPATNIYVDPTAQAWLVEVRGSTIVAVTTRDAAGRYFIRTFLPADAAGTTGFKLGIVVRRGKL